MSLAAFLAAQTEDVTVTIERDGTTQDIEVPSSALAVLSFGNMFGFGEGRGLPFGEGRGLPFNNFGSNGRLGVAFLTLNADVAEEQGVDATEGALVTEVLPGSPAEAAGLQANDIITAVNGESVDAEHTLRDRLFAYEPDDTVTLDVVRDSETQQIEVTLGQPELAANIMPLFNLDGFSFPNPDQLVPPEAPAQPNI